MKRFSQTIVIILFGVIIPSVVLFQAYKGISTLASDVYYTTTPSQLVTIFADAKKEIRDGNDYALFSHLYSEHSNQKAMINKQVMKVAIMQIGFAVISVGLMLIVLGINDGGAEGGGEVSNFKLNIKTSSTGVLVFMVGAIMATAGGVLKNEYTTVPIPKYILNTASSESEDSMKVRLWCRKKFSVDKDFNDCLNQGLREVNKEADK